MASEKEKIPRMFLMALVRRMMVSRRRILGLLMRVSGSEPFSTF